MGWVEGEDCGHHGNTTALFVSVTVTPCALCWAGAKVAIFYVGSANVNVYHHLSTQAGSPGGGAEWFP